MELRGPDTQEQARQPSKDASDRPDEGEPDDGEEDHAAHQRHTAVGGVVAAAGARVCA